MTDSIVDLGTHAAFAAIRKQQHNLEETVASLLELTLSQPVGDLRERLLEEVSCLDSIGDLIRQALDSVVPERKVSGRACL